MSQENNIKRIADSLEILVEHFTGQPASLSVDDKPQLKEPRHMPPSVNTGVDLDAEGLPWDGRIHGAAKKKLAKEGTWKLIKGVETKSPGIVEQVKAELRAAMAATEAAAPPPPPAATEVKYLVEGKQYTGTELAGFGWTPEQIASAEVCEEAPTPEAPTATTMTFIDIMQKIAPALAAGTITEAQVSAAANRQGLASMVLLNTRPDLIPAVNAELFPNG